MTLRIASLSFLFAAAITVAARPARACGGGVVTTQTAATIGANAQRIIVSVHGGMTDVITEIGVPSTTADYGVLIPVPGPPTLDPNPVSSADIQALDATTAPKILTHTSSGGGDSGCGCPLGAGSNKGGAGSELLDGGVQVSEPVAIGPVTAVALTADTSDAVSAWLAQSGFVIPAGDQSIIDAYAGPNRAFIAIRRSDSAATGGATSVGVHFTLAGDQRALPLRFARLGATADVGFTVFVAADDVAAPAAPFAALTLTDLDPTSIKTSGYSAALSAAIARHDNRAFVIEGSWPAADLGGGIGYTLQPVLLGSQHLTRLSAILPATSLDTDVVFDQTFTGMTPNQRVVTRAPASGDRREIAFGAVLLAFAAVARRRSHR